MRGISSIYQSDSLVDAATAAISFVKDIRAFGSDRMIHISVT